MDLSQVKLIVSDMDGTLLDANHNVSDKFFELFKELIAKNIHFVAASGRQYHSILHKLKNIKEHITIVAENGAYVVQNGKELYANAFPKKEAMEFIKLAQQIPDVFIVLAGKERAYFLNNNKALETMVAEYYSEYQLVANFDTLPNDAILKLALYHPNGSEANIYPYVQHLAEDWQIKVSGEFWVDIALSNNHKGNAVARIQQNLGVTNQQTMAFGDYMNDVEMLKKATYSFAMDNAHPEVKQIAKYVTLSNTEHGVEAVLEKLVAQL